MRAGSSLFSTLDVDCPLTLLRCVAEYLGETPAAWTGVLFDEKGQPTTDKADGRLLDYLYERLSMKEWISQIWDQPQALPGHQLTSLAPMNGEDRWDDEIRPYSECFRRKFWKPAAIQVDGVHLSGYNEDTDEIVESLPKISSLEAGLLVDLLSNIFIYEPDKRLSVNDIPSYPWFLMEE